MAPYRKNTKYRRNRRYKPKKRNDARVKALARQAVGSLKPMKSFAQDGLNQTFDLSTLSWIMFRPYDVPGEGPTANHIGHYRQTNNIWVNRFSGIAHINVNPLTKQPVEIRQMCGWYKGTSKPNDPPIVAFTATHLQNSFPNRLRRYDSSNFKIVEDKTFTVTPKMIYDSNGSDDSVGGESMLAVWNPLTLKCNFKINRKVEFTDYDDDLTGGTGGGNADDFNPAGDVHLGWVPFVAFQFRCPNQAFTSLMGSNPSPQWDYKFTTYFKDNEDGH